LNLKLYPITEIVVHYELFLSLLNLSTFETFYKNKLGVMATYLFDTDAGFILNGSLGMLILDF